MWANWDSLLSNLASVLKMKSLAVLVVLVGVLIAQILAASVHDKKAAAISSKTKKVSVYSSIYIHLQFYIVSNTILNMKRSWSGK